MSNLRMSTAYVSPTPPPQPGLICFLGPKSLISELCATPPAGFATVGKRAEASFLLLQLLSPGSRLPQISSSCH